ncbi:MAG: homoserine kinase [Candidatus Dormibacteria bacterium]
MGSVVRVPATVANLGPGFDILALALQLQNEVHAEVEDGSAVRVILAGGDETPSDAAENLVARAYVAACERAGVGAAARGVSLRCINAIPQGRGLGSSAAATLSGVLTALALHHAAWEVEEILELVAEFEGHRDNAAAALLGGLAICAPQAAVRRIDLDDELGAIVFAPRTRLSTAEARRVVPERFSRGDAVFNAGRCALLVRALGERDYVSLREAMDDRWHQRQRAALFPPLLPLLEAAYRGGADGACLAGAGPSVLALCAGGSHAVGEALTAAAAEQGVAGDVLALRIRNHGARVDVTP